MAGKIFCIAEINKEKVRQTGIIIILQYFRTKNPLLREVEKMFDLEYRSKNTESTLVFILESPDPDSIFITLKTETDFAKIKPFKDHKDRFQNVVEIARHAQASISEQQKMTA